MDFLLQHQDEINQTIDRLSVDSEIFKDAVKAQEWGFVSTCLRTCAIDNYRVCGFKDPINYELAVQYARQINIEMVSFIFLSRYKETGLTFSRIPAHRRSDEYQDGYQSLLKVRGVD